MPKLWDEAQPTSKWEDGTPVIDAQAESNTIISTPARWNEATPQKKITGSWEEGRTLPKPTSWLGKAFEFTFGEGMATGDFKRMTTFGQFLDLIGRPGYALKAAIIDNQNQLRQYLLDQGFSEEEIRQPLNVEVHQATMKFKPNIAERMKATWRGFTGQERDTFHQIWQNAGMPDIPFLQFAINMAGEITTDPLMWASGAGYRALTKAGKTVIKPAVAISKGALGIARKVPKVGRAIDYTVDTAGELKTAVYNTFVAKSKIPELASMADEYLTKRRWMAGKGIDFGVQTRNNIQRVMKETGKKADDIERMIVNVIEDPKKYKALASPGELQIAKAVQARLEHTFTTMTDAGVPISSLGAARRQRISELYQQLEGAVSTKKVKLLQQIDRQKQALQDEIIKFKGELRPLTVDVAHYSKNPNIKVWKVNKKTVKNDLGTDFGTEKAALARQQDIAKGGTGKVYYTKLSPKRSIDMTDIPMEEQLQYWDNPDDVVKFLSKKKGLLGPDEIEKIRNNIPDPQDIKFRQIKTTPAKTTTKLVAQPTGEEGLTAHLDSIRRYKPLTDAEIEALAEVPRGKEAIIGNLKVTYTPKTNKYNIYELTTTQATKQQGAFLSDVFYDAQNNWYADVRQRLLRKGYDSIKYYSLEDTAAPTYKILTGRVIGGPAKRTIAEQERLTMMISNNEAKVTNLVNEAKEIYHLPVSEKRIADTAAKLGIGHKEAKEIAQLQAARELGYFPRITTKEAEGFLKNAAKHGGYGAKVWNPKIKNALRRKTSDFTLDEWNNFVKENGIEALGSARVEEYFMRDPAYAVALYETRAAKAVTSAEFIRDVTKTFGKNAKNAPSWWQELPESVQKLFPASKGLKFDPEVIAEVTKVTNSYINPGSVNSALKLIDGIQNSWRKWTLAPFPKYHLRNMVGNLWNNYLADVDLIQYKNAQALQLYRKYKGTGGIREKIALWELRQAHMTPQMANDIIELAELRGVLGRGWYATDVDMGIRQQMTKGGFIQRGLAVGSTIENNARLAHFLDKLDKGMDSVEAAMSVKRYLFDYADITSFERQVMRRLFPFYTWTRKNLPLQMQELWKQPYKFAPMAIPLRIRDPEDLVKLKYARPDLYERLPVEFRRTVDAVTYVPLEGLIPAGDLAKMVRPHEMIFELLTPYLRAPIELFMNKSMYFESEIQKYPGETQELWRISMPVKMKYLLTTVLPQARLLSEIDKIVKRKIKKEELTPAEQAFSQSLSSIYKVSIRELRNRALRAMQKKVEELEKGMANARRNGRKDEEQRIRNTYKQLKETIRQIKRR